MDKVYEVVEVNEYEGETDVSSSIFASFKDAVRDYTQRISYVQQDFEDIEDIIEVNTQEGEEYKYIAYRDSYYSLCHTIISISVKEVK